MKTTRNDDSRCCISSPYLSRRRLLRTSSSSSTYMVPSRTKHQYFYYTRMTIAYIKCLSQYSSNRQRELHGPRTNRLVLSSILHILKSYKKVVLSGAHSSNPKATNWFVHHKHCPSFLHSFLPQSTNFTPMVVGGIAIESHGPPGLPRFLDQSSPWCSRHRHPEDNCRHESILQPMTLGCPSTPPFPRKRPMCICWPFLGFPACPGRGSSRSLVIGANSITNIFELFDQWRHVK